MSWRCGGCGREVHADRKSCLYCGWSKEEGAAAPTAAAPLAGSEDPDTFRAGGTAWRFVAWAVLAALIAGWAVGRARVEIDPSRAALFRSIALAGAVLGPLALAAQVLRMLLVKVTVDPRIGLVSGDRSIPWSAIESVDYAGLHIEPDRAVVAYLLDALRSVWIGPMAIDFWAAIFRIVATLLISALFLGVGFASGVLLPVFLLLSPFQPRVDVRLKDGRTLTWRDLRRESEFVRKVSAGLRRASG